MKIQVPLKITAADSNARTISGRIVTFDEVAVTSAGRTIFKAGSVPLTPVKLNLEHDRTRPIGMTLSMDEVHDEDDRYIGIDATFKIANTTAGTDALEEAMSGLRDGFSVGVAVDEYETVDGAMLISASELIEVSLVTEPAVRSARVSDVAASQEEEIKDSEVKEASDVPQQPIEGEQVEDTTVKDAPAVEETVEASHKVEASARPAFYTKPRIDINPVKYLENSVRASLGDHDARQYVLAADNTTDNAGLIPTRQLTEVVNGLSSLVRPTIDAISRGTLPDAGMTFEIPKITQVPTVAVTAEEAAPSEQDQNSSFVTVNVQKFAGQQTFSLELLDRSSPLFFEELMKTMAAAYAKATDARCNLVVYQNATGDATTTTTYPTAAELLGIVARGSASVYNATQRFAKSMIVNTSQWANIMTLNDNGRPIYNAAQPQNAGGVVRPDSLRGNVAGLDLFVTANTAQGTDTDGSILIVDPEAYTWYESPALKLQTNLISTGQIQVMYYGYGAIAVKIAGGSFHNNKA
jgi:HK97 family phage prohead protease